MLIFLVWSLVSFLFVCIGIYARIARKAVRFFTFEEEYETRDYKSHNRAFSHLWFCFAFFFEILGTPLFLFEDNNLSPIIVIVCMPLLVITTIYQALKIQSKYRK